MRPGRLPEGRDRRRVPPLRYRGERDRLVRREAFATVPVTVEYSIAPLGRTLADTVDALRIWGGTHIEAVLEAQRRYDFGETARALARSSAM